MSISHSTQELNTVSPIDLKRLTGLIKIGENFTREQAHELLKAGSKGKTITDAQARRYITWGKTLHLIEESGTNFIRTTDGRLLAEKETGTAEWKKLFHQFLLRDSVYRRFYEILLQYPRFERFETIERVGGWIGREAKVDNHVTPKILRNWAIELDILAKLPIKRRFILIDQELSLSQEEFWQKLVYVFKSLVHAEKQGFSVRIESVREEFANLWRMHPAYFDELLRQTALSKEYTSILQLSGGPARYVRELKKKGYYPLTVNRKQYMYIAILGSE